MVRDDDLFTGVIKELKKSNQNLAFIIGGLPLVSGPVLRGLTVVGWRGMRTGLIEGGTHGA